MRNRTSQFNLFSLILLVVLIVLFNKELFILGVRVYAAITDSPKAEQLLAGYYRIAARQNAEYAETFYRRALNGYQNKLISNNVTADEKAKINMDMGRFYECARGTSLDLTKARVYYLEAQKSAQNASDKSLGPKIKEALSRVDDEMAKPNIKPSCITRSDQSFFNTLFGMPDAVTFDEMFSGKDDSSKKDDSNKN